MMGVDRDKASAQRLGWTSLSRCLQNRAVVLGGVLAASVIVVALQAVAIVCQSMTTDEPYHLLAGYQALHYGQNTINLEHPPLVKLVGALPLLLRAKSVWPPMEASPYEALAPEIWRQGPLVQHTRMASRACEFLTFGLLFLLGCYWLGHELDGNSLGLTLAMAVGLSFDVVPFVAILQTDTGVAAGYALTIAALLRWRRDNRMLTAVWVGGSLGLALAAKFSGVLLVPIVAFAFALPHQNGLPWQRRFGNLIVAVAVSLAVLDATYWLANLHYDPKVGQDTIRSYCDGRGTLIVGSGMQASKEFLLRLESRAPMVAQYLTGVLGVAAQNKLGIYLCYAFGQLSTKGFWWYFPALVLTKTPLALLAGACLAGLVAIRSRRPSKTLTERSSQLPNMCIPAVACAIFLAVAMWSKYNVGHRHLLPVVPLLALPACSWAVRKGPVQASLLLVLLATESFALAPLWMAASNTWFLGKANPTRFAFSDSGGEYQQDFLVLSRLAERRGLAPLHVASPILRADELQAAIPSAILVDPAAPAKAGWYAVSIILEQYIPALERCRPEDVEGYESYRRIAASWKSVLEAIRRGQDNGYVAGTFHLYFVPAP